MHYDADAVERIRSFLLKHALEPESVDYLTSALQEVLQGELDYSDFVDLVRVSV
jgi:hypothetical protein